MDKKTFSDRILPEESYAESMKSVVLPYLSERRTTGYYEREKGQLIFYIRCLADAPRGIAILSHGFTETIDKHLENIYYFLCEGYHVFMPEHCGHGRSYRLCSNTKDLSLVHIDDYMRYVDDLLSISRMAAEEFPHLPIFLYGHSMGGGIAAAAAAKASGCFSRLILSSPMIRPSSAPTPWHMACMIAGIYHMLHKEEQYLPGHHPYDGMEQFADSAAASEARFRYYQDIRRQEPLFQTNAASYGWLWQAVRLHRFLQKDAWREINCPVLIFQAENDTYVSNQAQERFLKKLNQRNDIHAELIMIKGSKHEIFSSGTEILAQYWGALFSFLHSQIPCNQT